MRGAGADDPLEVRDEHGLAPSASSLRRYTAANVPDETRWSQVAVKSPWHAEARDQAQINYGMMGR